MLYVARYHWCTLRVFKNTLFYKVKKNYFNILYNRVMSENCTILHVCIYCSIGNWREGTTKKKRRRKNKERIERTN